MATPSQVKSGLDEIVGIMAPQLGLVEAGNI